jgi:hypothetical protein
MGVTPHRIRRAIVISGADEVPCGWLANFSDQGFGLDDLDDKP